MELEHDYNLGDAGAVFYRQESKRALSPLPWSSARRRSTRSARDGTTIVSSVIFEVEITKEKLPGILSPRRIRTSSHYCLEAWNSRRSAAPGQERAGVWYAQGAIEGGFCFDESAAR